MREKYRERAKQPCEESEIKRETTRKQVHDKRRKYHWPLSEEFQMWQEVRCFGCDRPAHWVGMGHLLMSNDDGPYFLARDAWCYFCFPQENFTQEELPMVRHAEWARKETVNYIVEIISDQQRKYDDPLVESVMSDLRDRIIAALKSPEERALEWEQWKQAMADRMSSQDKRVAKAN